MGFLYTASIRFGGGNFRYVPMLPYYHVTMFPPAGEPRVGGPPIPPAAKLLLVTLGHQAMRILVDPGRPAKSEKFPTTNISRIEISPKRA